MNSDPSAAHPPATGADRLTPGPSRTDLHCHSAASARRRAVGLRECLTPPEEVYRLAKARGMDFVTITDHDSIAGVLEIADRPDVFLSEELTARFAGEPQAVHVLCFGITAGDHEWLAAHKGDVEAVAAYLHGHEIACALAHPFLSVAAPLTPGHRRALAELFPVWETRNGMCSPELNAPAAVYAETHGGGTVGGSDDHGGVDVGRTWTETPSADTAAEFLAHVRAGAARAGGAHGSPAARAHGSLAVAARALTGVAGYPDGPLTVLPGRDRETACRISPASARESLDAWTDAVGFGPDATSLTAGMQAAGFDHDDLARRARRVHERRAPHALGEALLAAADDGSEGLGGAGRVLAPALLPVLPYLPAAAGLARARARLAIRRDGEPLRVAVVADGAGEPALSGTLAVLREQGVAGFELDVIGTDANVDRRLASVGTVGSPLHPGLELGAPSLPLITEAMTDRPYDLLHVAATGPAGALALLVARALGLPAVGSLHAAPVAPLHPGGPAATALRLLYGRCRIVLSAGPATDAALAAAGVDAAAVARWDRGVDLERFGPARYAPGVLPADRFNVLAVGRLDRRFGSDLLTESFLLARDRDPRLHLVLVGRGPDEVRMRRRLGRAATFLGTVEGDALARLHASADLLLFPGGADTFAGPVLEAQASGLPVLAVATAATRDLIEDGRSGCLVPDDAVAVATALRHLARREAVRDRISTGGLLAVRGRSWSRSLAQLAATWSTALAGTATAGEGVPHAA